ncbi:MAG: neutral zinc metallopeptidase, partial [Pseudomonadota bacterium]
MRWRGRRESSNIEDIRGGGSNSGGGGFGRGGGFRIPRNTGGRGRIRRASGGGFGTIILLVVGFFLLRACGINPLDMLAGGGGNIAPQTSGQTTQVNDTLMPPARNAPPTQARSRDDMTTFIAVVLAETEDVWKGIFQQQGRIYPEPKLVLFKSQVRSACGKASSATGPFYCPGDSKIYLDTQFFDTLSSQFGAPGDFANAYVIAHEVGHHVQNVIGVLPKYNQLRRSMSKVEANQMSVRIELQADCFAGIWAHFTERKGLLEKGDLEEALNAATHVGDDTIQKRQQGYVVPESFSHGTAAQRSAWFFRGFETGKLRDCDTR